MIILKPNKRGCLKSEAAFYVKRKAQAFYLMRAIMLFDVSIAHFIGMHALQILPLLAFYLFRDVRLVIFVGLIYGALSLFCLIQALNARSLLSFQ